MKHHTLWEWWPFDRRATHAVLALSTVIALLVLMIYLQAVFTPLIIALILAYIFNPLANFGERLGAPRWLSTTLIFAFSSLLLAILLTVIVPSVLEELQTMINETSLTVPKDEVVVEYYRKTAKPYVTENFLIRSSEILESRVNKFKNNLGEMADNAMGKMADTLTWTITKTFKTIVTLLLIAFYFFFLLNSLNKIWNYTNKYLVPYEYRGVFHRLSQKIHISLSAFFRGRLVVCLLVSILMWIGLTLLDVPFPMIFAFGIGFSTIVPFLGLLFLIPACLFYGLDPKVGMVDLSLLVGLYMVAQSLEMFVLTPLILGKEVELHPLLLLFSIILFWELFDVMGMLLAVPIASTLKILYREFIFPSFLELSQRSPTENDSAIEN